MPELYPLKFQTIFKEKIWGGQKINTVLGKDYGNLENCGETWELSGVDGNVSLVSNGNLKGLGLDKILKDYGKNVLGKKIHQHFGNEFPLLIKFIDAAQDLSIQVHPDDKLAKERHNGSGKTEMWYILQADEGSTLIDGFAKNTSREEYQRYLDSGRLQELLNVENVKKGDAFYLPAGRVHTIGKGLLLAEIQQTSDITYRIYDFDRVDKNGIKRELHTELALDAIDFSKIHQAKSPYGEKKNECNSIVKTPFFSTNKFNVDDSLEIDHSSLDSFKIYICTSGSGRIAGEELILGDVLLIPASIKTYRIEPIDRLELLETYIDPDLLK